MKGQNNSARLRRNGFARALRTLWRGFREWCGDAAYERYLASRGVRESSAMVLTRTEFYLEQANRRYSQPNRCC